MSLDSHNVVREYKENPPDLPVEAKLVSSKGGK